MTATSSNRAQSVLKEDNPLREKQIKNATKHIQHLTALRNRVWSAIDFNTDIDYNKSSKCQIINTSTANANKSQRLIYNYLLRARHY